MYNIKQEKLEYYLGFVGLAFAVTTLLYIRYKK
jgi:hypothetical protein